MREERNFVRYFTWPVTATVVAGVLIIFATPYIQSFQKGISHVDQAPPSVEQQMLQATAHIEENTQKAKDSFDLYDSKVKKHLQPYPEDKDAAKYYATLARDEAKKCLSLCSDHPQPTVTKWKPVIEVDLALALAILGDRYDSVLVSAEQDLWQIGELGKRAKAAVTCKNLRKALSLGVSIWNELPVQNSQTAQQGA